MGWGRERGPRVIDFFTKNPNLKKKEKKGGGGQVGVGGGGGGLGWGGLDKQAQTNLPLQLLRSWGH